jgi:hypothetical protein
MSAMLNRSTGWVLAEVMVGPVSPGGAERQTRDRGRRVAGRLFRVPSRSRPAQREGRHESTVTVAFGQVRRLEEACRSWAKCLAVQLRSSPACQTLIGQWFGVG